MSGKSNIMGEVFREAWLRATSEPPGGTPGGTPGRPVLLVLDTKGGSEFATFGVAAEGIPWEFTDEEAPTLQEWAKPLSTTGKTVTFEFAPSDSEIFSEQTAQDITRLREIVLECGWIQHNFRDEDGVCILGGVIVVADGAWLRHFAMEQAILRYLIAHDLISYYGGSIAQYNDAPGRTVGEVLAVLERIAVWVKEKAHG